MFCGKSHLYGPHLELPWHLHGLWKIETIVNRKTCTNLSGIHALIGIADTYRRFIRTFSGVTELLYLLVRKEESFLFSPAWQTRFGSWKPPLVETSVLAAFGWDIEIILENGTSDYLSKVVLSLYGDDGTLHVFAFYSKKHSTVECNYKSYDKAFPVIIICIEEWCLEQEEARH